MRKLASVISLPIVIAGIAQADATTPAMEKY